MSESCWAKWTGINRLDYRDQSFENCLKTDSYVQSVLQRRNFTSLRTKIRNRARTFETNDFSSDESRFQSLHRTLDQDWKSRAAENVCS